MCVCVCVCVSVCLSTTLCNFQCYVCFLNDYRNDVGRVQLYSCGHTHFSFQHKPHRGSHRNGKISEPILILSSQCMVISIFAHIQVLTNEAGDDPQMNACKLLEVLVLQCKGHIDQV